MPYKISFEPNPRPDDIQSLGDNIMAYAKQQKGQEPLQFFAFFIRDEDNTIIGGCNGCTLYGSLYIDQLWVDDSIRHQGYGTQLIKVAEQFGLDHQCTFATVNTMDWEAEDFYKKLGFKVDFVRSGYEKNSKMLFLSKML